MTKRLSWSANAPPWDDFKGDRDKRRNWLSYVDRCFDHLYQENLNGSALNTKSFDEYLALRNVLKDFNKVELSTQERGALLAGMTASSVEHKWGLLAKVIREHGSSIELSEIISDMIEYGGFHPKANFEQTEDINDEDLEIFNQYLYICELLRKIYPERDERAIIPRSRDVVANFVARDDTDSSISEASEKVHELTRGLEARVERAKLRLLRARVERGDRSMPIPCRVYTRK